MSPKVVYDLAKDRIIERGAGRLYRLRIVCGDTVNTFAGIAGPTRAYNPTWEICDRVSGRNYQLLLHAMFDVGYFPPNTPQAQGLRPIPSALGRTTPVSGLFTLYKLSQAEAARVNCKIGSIDLYVNP